MTQADGAAAANASVWLNRVSGGFAGSTTTDSAGKYSFTNLVLNEAYYVRAFHPIQTAQSRSSTNRTAVADGDVLIANVTLPAQATVRVTVKRPNGTVFSGARVQIKSAFDATFVNMGNTDAVGVRSIPNVGEGPFAIRILDPITNGVIGAADGAVALADHGKTIDVAVTTGIGLPTDLFDGNNFRFDIQPDGHLINGSDDAYDDAQRLELVANGTSQSFTGATVGLVEEAGREIAIAQSVAGLDVTRKIFVPSDGYFARYLEVLKNTSAAPVTVDVKIASNLGSNFQTQVAATSSGDTVFSAADSWLVTDDDNLSTASGDPALAFVIGGAGAARTVSLATQISDDLTYRWDSVTVPPNSTVILMHFAVQQRLKVSAIAAAQRLVQLPPEAIAGLSADERAQIVNWQVPADGSSALPPLPPRGGSVSGQARAADNVTPLKNATVTFLSPNSLMRGGYGSATTDATGAFSFANVAVDAFTLQAIDPLTLAGSPVTNGAFAAGQISVSRDVVFTNTAVVKGTVKQNGVPVNGFVLTSVAGRPLQVATVNGTYVLTGLPAGTYYLVANVAGVRGTIVVQVADGQVIQNADIPIGAGTITGIVRFARGVATPAGTQVLLTDPNGLVPTAFTSTDSTGRYTFNSVSIGTPYTVTATHPTNTFAKRAVAGVVVGAGQTTPADITLPASANVHVTVFDIDGVKPFAGATIRIDRHDGLGLVFGGVTGPAGDFLFPNVTEPGFSVQASDAAGIIGTAEGVVATADDNSAVNVTVTASSPGGTVQGHVWAADGATPINAGMTLVELIDSVTGQVLKSQPASGGWYSLSATFPTGHGFIVRAHSPVDPSTVVEATGAFMSRSETVQKNLTLPVAVVKGVIQFSDGAGVPFPSPTLTQTTPETTHTWFASRNDASGGYGIVVLATGPFTLTAQDQTSGLTRTVEGTVVDLTSAIDLNVTLPESASIKGTLTSVDGQPAAAKSVRLASVGMPSTRSTTTDAQGRFQFDHVALTPFRVQGCDFIGGIQLCAGDGGALTSAGANLTLAIAPAGSLSGTVFADASQTTVVPSADLYLVNSDYAGPNYTGGFRKHVFTNAGGIYASGSVPPGKYTVTALASGNRAGIATGVLSPGGTNTINVPLGNATGLAPEKFNGTSGFLYDIGCDGEIYNGGQPGLASFYGGSILSMTAGSLGAPPLSYFSCLDAGLFELNKRGVALDGGRDDVVGLEVARKVFVPETAEFARYLEVFTNRTTMDLTVRVSMEGWLTMGDENATVTVKPSDTGNTTAVFADASGTRPSVGFVLGGQGAPVSAIPTRVVDHRHDYKYEWIVTVPAGQTRSILNFVVQGPAAGAATVANQASSLAALSDPMALTGLTAAEKASIVNFVIP